MPPEEKSAAMSPSAPPRSALTEIELLITLDRIQREMKSNREEQRREFELIRADLKTAKDNDERFKAMEHDFRLAKWFAVLAGGAAILALANGIISRFSWRADLPPPPSNAERMGSDRITPPTLQGR